MNCEQASEKLIDLVYEELPGDEARAVGEHILQCPRCREEFEKLQLARSALVMYRAGEPKGSKPVVRPYRRFLIGVAGVAAAILIAVGVWMFQEGTTDTAIAGPVEIKRLNVSLTILSEPENWPGYYPRFQQGPGQMEFQMDAQANNFSDVQTFRRVMGGGWRGLALVRDQRIVRNIKRGVTSVRFTDVPAGILPDTVRLRSLDDPDGLTILEQNYQYDLASASAVMKRYIDKTVTITFKNGETLPAGQVGVSGTLLSFDRNTLVIQPEGEGPRNISRKMVKAITFEKLPAGLLSKPTLMWQLKNAAAANQQFEVAYLTGGLTWRADYILKLRPAVHVKKRAGHLSDQPLKDKVSIIDTADIVGYATVTNNSGVTYENAQLKLLAGDVNLIKPEVNKWSFFDGSQLSGGESGGPQFKEKSFFEYHLYTLGRPTTIRSAETKQIELISGSGIRMKRGYVYDPTVNATAVRVVSEFKNSKDNGLGKPLPKGVIRLYAPDPTGVSTYVAKTSIDHTPKDEKIRLPWGFAFDIVCSVKQTDYKRRGYDRYHKWQYDLRNHKDYDVTITIIMRRPKTTHWAKCTKDGKDYPWHIREVGVWEVEVPVKANSAEKIIFEYRQNPQTGGGLKSPYDRD